MHIAIASDHAGFEYKERLKLFLIESGHVVEDFGTHDEQSVDYPLVIRPCAEAVASGEFDRGIVLGGSGNGEAIVANRVPGVRCTLCWNLKSARLARQHNNANVLSLGQRMIGFDEARAIVECWLETQFDGGRHLRRIRQIDRPPPAPDGSERNGPLPHRLALEDQASYVCESCRQEFLLPVDITAGAQQQHVEECPVCCHENVILIDVDEESGVRVRGSRDVTT